MTIITRQRIKLIVTDLLSAMAGFLLFDIVRFYTIPTRLRPDDLFDFLTMPPVLAEQILVPPLVILLFAVMGSYNRSNTLYKSRLDESLLTIIVSFLTMLAVYFVALVDDDIPERITSYELMMSLFLCLTVPMWISRMIVLTHNARRVRAGHYSINTLIIGAWPGNRRQLERLQRSASRLGLKFVAVADADGDYGGDTFAGLPVYTGAIADIIARTGAQAILVMPASKGPARTSEIIENLYRHDLPIFVSPDLYGIMGVRPRISTVAAEPLVDITSSRITPFATNFKRICDVAISALALVVLLPVYAILAAAVIIDSGGPVIYRQRRIGRNKRPFDILKFRTMRTDAENDGPALASADDPRITAIGRIMRKYRLDELPQFWNVLAGEMSLVGPRPERDYYVRQIVERCPAYTLVHQVRPGITSWGMVKYGYASDVDQMVDRLQYDLLYLENVSLAVDLKIIFHTIRTVVTGKGL